MKNIYQVRKNNIKAVVALLLLFDLTFFLFLPLRAQTSDSNPALRAAGAPISLNQLVSDRINKMSTDSFAELNSNSTKNNVSVAQTKTATGQETTYYVLNVEFKTLSGRQQVFNNQKQSRVNGVYILTVFDRFADVFIDSEEAWDAIYRNPNVLKADVVHKVTAPPPPESSVSPLVSQAVPETIARGGFNGLTGKNVIIALLDTGIDFRHPDFISYDSQNRPTSRIKYLWDTATPLQNGRGSIAPFRYPNGTSIGTLYTQEQLTNELRSTTITIPATDVDGHGTACTSVAAGNGNADQLTNGLKRKEVVGVAPDAEIIGVRLGYDGLENGYLINAIVEWLNKVASTTPLVISGSFGGHYSGHDGQTIEERQLDARFPLNKPGRSIVFAAGNEGNDKIHAGIKFSKAPQLLSWEARESTVVQIYFDSNDKGIAIVPTQATPLAKNLRKTVNPITNQWEVEIDVDPGPGGVYLENLSGNITEAHAFFLDRSLGRFAPDIASASYLVGTPGAMHNAITVGSYDWNDNFHTGGRPGTLTSVCRASDGAVMSLEVGWLSCYSSPGPLRSIRGSVNVTKPDIVSPGEWYSSSYAHIPGKGGAEGWRVDSTGNYVAMNGTSAATPYTAGIVALIFQKKPTLTVGEIKDLLIRNSSKTSLSPQKGAIPNNNWGYGKLDIQALDRIFQSL